MFLWHHQGLGCTDPPCGNNLCIRLNFRCNTATSHHDVCVRADCDLMRDSSSLIRSDFPGCLSSCPGSRKWDGHVTVLASTAVIHPGAAALDSPLHGLNVIKGPVTEAASQYGEKTYCCLPEMFPTIMETSRTECWCASLLKTAVQTGDNKPITLQLQVDHGSPHLNCTQEAKTRLLTSSGNHKYNVSTWTLGGKTHYLDFHFLIYILVMYLYQKQR